VPSADETARYFDENAEALRRGGLIDKWAALAPLFEGVARGATVVECGAGTGLYTLPLADAGYAMKAVDLSSASLTELTDAAERAGVGRLVECIPGDFRTVVATITEPVDVVTFIKVLHHFPDHEAMRDAIKTAWDALRPGGRIVLFEPNGTSPMWPIVFAIRGRKVWRAERNTFLMHARFFDRTFRGLPGARSTRGYRYLVPGTVATRAAILDRVDRVLVGVPGLRALSANVWYVVEKPA
jgi:2-polyprenyl-3-methyl-5-hydroxy-6-metoxy-1,4-benzoquinol methylase